MTNSFKGYGRKRSLRMKSGLDLFQIVLLSRVKTFSSTPFKANFVHIVKDETGGH